MSDDLTDKQKRRQVDRIHLLLFEVLEESADGDDDETTLVSMNDDYMEIFNKYFPLNVEMKVDDLEDRILACVKDITLLMIEKDSAVNFDYAKLVVYYLLMQLITQNLSVKEVHSTNDDMMFG
jgi:hypothetical protein